MTMNNGRMTTAPAVDSADVVEILFSVLDKLDMVAVAVDKLTKAAGPTPAPVVEYLFPVAELERHIPALFKFLLKTGKTPKFRWRFRDITKLETRLSDAVVDYAIGEGWAAEVVKTSAKHPRGQTQLELTDAGREYLTKGIGGSND